MHKNLHILSISTKFSAGQPYFQHITFQPQWPLPLALIAWGAVASQKFLAIENMHRNGVRSLWFPDTFGPWSLRSLDRASI